MEFAHRLVILARLLNVRFSSRNDGKVVPMAQIRDDADLFNLLLGASKKAMTKTYGCGYFEF